LNESLSITPEARILPLAIGIEGDAPGETQIAAARFSESEADDAIIAASHKS